MSSNYKIAVVGPSDMVRGFRSLGVSVFEALNWDEARERIVKIKKGEGEKFKNFAVVVVIESLLKEASDEEYQKLISGGGALPAIIAVPGLEGSSSKGVLKIKRLAEKAIGSDILS